MLIVTLCMPQGAVLWPLPAEPLFCDMLREAEPSPLPVGLSHNRYMPVPKYTLTFFLCLREPCFGPSLLSPFLYHAAGS